MEGAAIRWSRLAASNRLIPLRHWISQRLDEFYAQPASAVVGAGQPAALAQWGGSVWNDDHWKRRVHRLYQQQQGRWLTPVELFQPYYSWIITEFIVQAFQSTTTSTTTSTSAPQSMSHSSAAKSRILTHRQHDASQQPGNSPPYYPTILDVVEWGGGRGTNAHWILDRLRDAYPSLYPRVRYTLLDASPTLLQVQMQRLHSGGHGPKVHGFHLNVLDVAERAAHTVNWLPSPGGIHPSSSSSSSSPLVMLGLELLDNLSHDKLRFRPQYLGSHHLTSRDENDDDLLSALEFAQVAAVHELGGEPVVVVEEEVFTSVQDDPLLMEVIPSWLSLGTGVPTGSTAFWIPTAALGMLRRLRQERPQAHVLLADFDWLPPPDRLVAPTGPEKPPISTGVQRAVGDPLITCMDGFDHENYLNAPRCSDILFPTDFPRLSRAIEDLWQHSSIVPLEGTPTPTSWPPRVHVMKQTEFLQRYGPHHVAATRHWLTGYTPLLADFVNCSVLTVAPGSQEELHNEI